MDLGAVASHAVGLDLGLKELLASPHGLLVTVGQFYRDLEPALAVAQVAGNKARVKASYAKAANRRKDFLHKRSSELVAPSTAVFLGNINAQAIVRTVTGKSTHDCST